MRSTTTKFFAVGALGLLSVAFAAQDGVLIRRKLVEGEKLAYVATTTTQQTVEMPNGMGDQDMTVKVLGTYTLTTGKVDGEKGSADIKVFYNIDKTEADGPMAAMMNGDTMPKKFEFEGTLDAQGNTKMTAPKMEKTMQMMMSSNQSLGPSPYSMVLPEKAVKPGDTWEVSLPKSLFTGDKDQKIVSKYVGEKVVDGVPAYEVSTEGTVAIDVDLGKIMTEGPMAGQQMLMKGTVQISVTGFISKATGAPISMKQVLKTKQTMDMVSMGMKIATTGTTTTDIKLK